MAYTSTLQKLSKNLLVTYENTIFSNSTNVGDSREKGVIEYLKKVMAHKYGFQSGEIFDEDDTMSGQVDVIIYDNLFSTVFTDGTDKILSPVESTYGIISVKSKMGIRELDNAIEGIKKYDALKRPQTPDNTMVIMPDLQIKAGANITFTSTGQQNINCIFAFDTTIGEETLLKKIKAAGCIDLVVVPGRFCIIGRHRKEFGFNNEDGTPLVNTMVITETSVAMFIVMLQLYLKRNQLIARDISSLAQWIIRQSSMLRLREDLSQ